MGERWGLGKAHAGSGAATPTQLHTSQGQARELGPEPSNWPFIPRGGWEPVARFSIAVGASAALCLLLGRFAAPSLTGPTDVVGYPTFWNYNFEPTFWTYRLIVYAFPLFTIVGYVLLARFGPLRSRSRRPAKQTIELVEPAPTATPASEGAWGSALARILLPAAVVVAACGARTGKVDLLAVAAGAVYAVLVIAVAEAWARHTDGQRWYALSAVNGAGGAIAAVLSLWFVAAHTVVQTATGTRSWPWLAWWLPLPAVMVIAWWAARQLRGGRAARDVELTLLAVVVGAIALFLAMSILPGQITFFQGFDDAQEMAGASLVAHGYLPWRDVLFIHGLFPDVLTGSLGRAVFGDSIWGIDAIHSVILIPLFWVNAYLFAVWVSRRNPWFLGLVVVGITCGLRPMVELERSLGQSVAQLLWSERFIGLPVALIVLGETLRRRSVGWAATLTLLLFVEQIFVPETIFVAAPALGCVVAADLVHRRPQRSLWANLRLTRWCVGTGVVATAAWAACLAAFGALRAFIDYYIVFGSGHNLAGAIRPTGISATEWTMVWLDIGCLLLTIWAVAVKVATRADWEARDWVAVAAAGFVALYLEKALGRFDAVHVWQVFGAGAPLVLFWFWRILGVPGQLLITRWHGWRARPLWLTNPATAALVAVIALGLVFTGPLRGMAGQHHLTGVTEANFGRLGYAAAGSIDTGLLRDLDTAIRAYAGEDGSVFDMTNSLGDLYFVLGRTPGTRFTHVDMAIPEYAQHLLIDDLKAARPSVVIYDATAFGMPIGDSQARHDDAREYILHGWTAELGTHGVMGMPIWDGITGPVRHYDVSEYVLRGWTPMLRTHGVLVMVRNDLVGSRPVPTLTTPPQTTDLYFSGPPCRWGATPNYLPVPDSSRATMLPVRSAIPRMVVYYSGWAVDPATNLAASTVLIADGDRVVGTTTPSIDRPDVAEYLHQAASVSGFQFNAVFDPSVHPSIYLVGADGIAHPLDGTQPASVAALRLSDGSQVRVSPTMAGKLEVHNAEVYTVGEIQLPARITLHDDDLAMLTSIAGLNRGKVALTDAPGDPHHEISAIWLDQAGPHLALRVGSCPQWYGYVGSKRLYVMQSGGLPVTTITLSAIRR